MLEMSMGETLSSSHSVVEGDLPVGGLDAWCTVLGTFLSEFCGYGHSSAFGVYLAFYSEHYLQNESPSAISWIGSIVAFLVTGMGPMCGPLFDRGYLHHVYISGAILQSLSIFMVSLIQPGQYYQVLLAQGLTSGIGQGLMYIPAFAVLSHHFKRRRSVVMSIGASGVALGGIVHTIMLNKLLNSTLGFKMGVRISETFVTVLLFLLCILMRTRGRAPGGHPVQFLEVNKKVFYRSSVAIDNYWAAYLYTFYYFQVDSLKHEFGNSFAFYSIVIINAGSFFGRFVAGPLLQFIGVIDLTIASTFICAVLIIGMIWLRSVISFVTLGGLYGVFSGINIAMMAPMLGLTSDPAELGVRMGVGAAITGIGGLEGPPICGALLTGRYLWWVPAIFCGAVALTSCVLFVGVRVSFIHTGASSMGRRARSS